MKRYTLTLLLALVAFFGVPHQASAQNMRWKKHVKVADAHFQKSEYGQAADHYLAAWKKRPSNRDLIQKAAISFLRVKDYEEAVKAFELSGNRFADAPDLMFLYAQALKQSGRYQDASKFFATFYDTYTGPNQEEYKRKALQEIKGCELALQWGRQAASPTIEIRYPEGGVNSSELEFAPIPINDDILYFSSTREGKAKIFRSQKEDAIWQEALPPANFPYIEAGHVCNGALSPDNERFYFTVCEDEKNWGDLTTRCEIYLIRRRADSWTSPEKLREYINVPNATTTHPSVVYNGDVEILYFASNRSEGEGGMDIWYTTRDINSGDLDFTFPINAGPGINTPDDEITPHYNFEEGTLYFASNGHIGLGGFDIFKAAGVRNNWSEVSNMGIPFNSSADDAYYIRAKFQPVGYFTSNRRMIPEKPNTTQEDIFAFTRLHAPDIKLAAGGRVYDQNGNPVAPATISLYLLTADDKRTLLETQDSKDGRYNFELRAGRSYQVDVNTDAFVPASFDLSTHQYVEGQNFGRPLFLERQVDPNTPAPETPLEPIVDNPEPTPPDEVVPTEIVDDFQEEEEAIDESEASEPMLGVHYKIQLAAVSNPSIDENERFESIKHLGKLEVEAVPGKSIYRILLSGFTTLSEARNARTACRENGFPDAYTVRYQGEVRGKMIN